MRSTCLQFAQFFVGACFCQFTLLFVIRFISSRVIRMRCPRLRDGLLAGVNRIEADDGFHERLSFGVFASTFGGLRVDVEHARSFASVQRDTDILLRIKIFQLLDQFSDGQVESLG